METTKQKIIKEALALFATKGYDATSMTQIASKVGIKAPSIYKHYKSKQDIFDAIFVEMDRQYKLEVESLQLDGSDASKDSTLYASIQEEQLYAMAKHIFLYFLENENACHFRKLLTVEQFHNKELSKRYVEQFIDLPIEYQSHLFTLLGQLGVLKKENTTIMAMHFYSPILLLLTLCDNDPTRKLEALLLIKQHIHQFNTLYRKGEEK